MLSCLLGAACAEAPAVRSRWNFQPRAKVVHTAVETIHGPTDDAVLPPLCAAWSCSRKDMSARTTNVKQQPDRFSRITGPAAHTFRRSLVQRGGKPDDTKVPFVALVGQFAAMVTVWNVSGLACQNEDMLWTVRD